MKILAGSFLLLSTALFAADPVVSAPSAAADQAFAAFETTRDAKPPESPRDMGAAKYYAWFDGNRQQEQAAGLAFYAQYPHDARRWTVVGALLDTPPLYVKEFGPDVETKGMAAAIYDEPAKAAWAGKADELRQALLAADDAPAELKEAQEWFLFAKDFRATSAAKQKGEPYDYGVFRARFAAHAAKYAELEAVGRRAKDYLGALERNLPGTSVAEWRLYIDSPNASLRDAATAQIKYLDTMSKPLDIVFTAVDGRPVDLKALRGKVVLVDFWATWCGPCKAELPNVVANYNKYHDRGFEVVGIALESANLTPKDTPEQKAAKLEKAKKVLTDFTAENGMPWPQYFDGKFWKNDISTQYAIAAIPAMFLIDQDGKVVSTNARGEKLESEVKRLLKL